MISPPPAVPSLACSWPPIIPFPAETSLRLYFDELLGRAKEAAAKAEKALRRAREDFSHMLRSMRWVWRRWGRWEEWCVGVICMGGEDLSHVLRRAR